MNLHLLSFALLCLSILCPLSIGAKYSRPNNTNSNTQDNPNPHSNAHANGCINNFSYIQTETGVEIHLSPEGSARIIRLEAKTPKVIRMTATMNPTLDKAQSLSVIETAPVEFRVCSTDSTVTLKTLEASAVCHLPEGRVDFYDKDGMLKLSEASDGRSFSPIEVEGTPGWTVSQRFNDLNTNEGLYGLGQHQADEFNYKGKNEALFQYNTKVSVPMIVSTDNYGVLWDSYSLVRFGREDDYKHLPELFTLYDKDGNIGALTGTCIDASADTLVRAEEDIYFEHLIRGDLNHVINLPRDFNLYDSKVVFEGEIEAPQSGVYPFILYYAGYITVYLDGEEVVPQRWRTAWNPNSYKFYATLKEGARTPIRIEWEPNGGVSYCGLRAYPVKDYERDGQMRWWGEMQDDIDYYFICGEDMEDVVRGYRAITGKAPIMPRWVMGYWQSREKYNTQEEVLSTLAEFRRRNIPIDNIVIDWLHWKEDQWGSHEFDPSRFPNPKEMVDSIHALDGRVMISVWPKFYVNTDHYKEFDQKGWMYRQAINDSIRDWVGPGYLGSFYDAYSPEARRLFWSQIQDHYYPLGMDAWWMDASEPNIRDCTDLQYRKDLCGPTAMGPSTKYFNAYALVNAEAIYNGQRSVEPDRRVFLLTRSGFAGLQRYSTATWSGDIATRWEDLKAQITAAQNFSISGIPWWSMDIGGFCVEDRYVRAMQQYLNNRNLTSGNANPSGNSEDFENTKDFENTGNLDSTKSLDNINNIENENNEDLEEWRELNTRWHQFGVFTPIYRSHGQWPQREPWNIAPDSHPAYNTILYYDRLRYHLLPYIYSLAAMTHFDDYTLLRPLVMDFTDDTNTFDLSDQYMFGATFMVAPVYTYKAREREVYFPEGSDWYNFYTGKKISGGQRKVVEAPYERMPLFVREGAIIPFGPQIQSTSQRASNRNTLLETNTDRDSNINSNILTAVNPTSDSDLNPATKPGTYTATDCNNDDYNNDDCNNEVYLYVYDGKDGEFTLYDDQGSTYAYERGEYSKIPIRFNNTDKTLTIGQREGSYPEMPTVYEFHIILVSEDNPVSFSIDTDDTEPTTQVRYDGNEVRIPLH